MVGLGLEQVGQDLHGRAVALKACGDGLVEGPGHALQRPSWAKAWIISCRCTGTSQQVVAGAVGDGRMAQDQRLAGVDRLGRWRLAPPGQDVEDDLVAGRAGVQGLADGVIDHIQAIDQHRRQHANEAAVGPLRGSFFHAAAQPRRRRRVDGR